MAMGLLPHTYTNSAPFGHSKMWHKLNSYSLMKPPVLARLIFCMSQDVWCCHEWFIVRNDYKPPDWSDLEVLIQVIYRWMLYIQQLALSVSVNMCCPQDCFVLVAVADCTQVLKNVDVGGCITAKLLRTFWTAQLPALPWAFSVLFSCLWAFSHTYTHLSSVQLGSHSHASYSTAAHVFWGTPMTSEWGMDKLIVWGNCNVCSLFHWFTKSSWSMCIAVSPWSMTSPSKRLTSEHFSASVTMCLRASLL